MTEDEGQGFAASPPCCNLQLSATVSTQCDKVRQVTLDVLNNCPSAVSVQLDFGRSVSDVVSFSIAPFTTQALPRPYLPGTYTAVLHIPGCPDQSVTFTVPPCTGACCLPDGSCKDGMTQAQCQSLGGTYMGDGHTCASVKCPSGNGGDPCKKTFRKWFCPLLLALMTFFTAIGLALILLSTCPGFSSIASYLLATGAILIAIGVIALILYWIFCTKCLCGWFYLFLWRVLFGVGIIITVFAGCCSSTFMWTGLVMIVLGILFLFLWKKQCKKTICELLKEVILVMAVYILPIISAVLGLGVNCLLVLFTFGSFNFTFLQLVSIIFASLVIYDQNNC